MIQAYHYSRRAVLSSQIHIGVFLGGELHGAMSFGAPIDKRRMVGIVAGSQWNEFLELNRMAFGPALPRNSESRALAVAMKLLRKHAPHLKWIVSFADGTQCGDGTIYRAAGFVLTQIKKNTTLVRLPDGSVAADKSLNELVGKDGRRGMAAARAAGARPLEGFQLRYIYFLDPEARSRLSCPEIPFSRIAELGARMYRGKRPGERRRGIGGPPSVQEGESGSNPTPALQSPRPARRRRSRDSRPESAGGGISGEV